MRSRGSLNKPHRRRDNGSHGSQVYRAEAFANPFLRGAVPTLCKSQIRCAMIARTMTIALGWIGTRRDGRQSLYLASDSRVRGGHVLDACPKVLTLPRSDCAICFAGDTAGTYPLMLQIANAIAAHEPARTRELDLSKVKDHLLRVFTDMANFYKDQVQRFVTSDLQFIFAGYSWQSRDFRIWTIYYSEKERVFHAREARSFNRRLSKAAFVGDWATRYRQQLARKVDKGSKAVFLEPLVVLAQLLQDSGSSDTIGGPPQLVRIGQNMTTTPICVRWGGADTLFGRPLMDYENSDYRIVEPFTQQFMRSRAFGYRHHDELPEVDEIGEVSSCASESG